MIMVKILECKTPRYDHGQTIGMSNPPRYDHGQNIGELNPSGMLMVKILEN